MLIDTVTPLAYSVLSGIAITCIIYAATILAILQIPWVEQHAVYMHRLKLNGGNDLNHPEQSGFAYRQVTPLVIETKDGARLHAWHVLPIGLYCKNFTCLVAQARYPAEKFKETLNFRLLRDDPEARLVIHTHGSSGCMASYCRTECYRSLSSTMPDKIHVLAFDYRGFGLSSGTPSEQGLIIDAQAVFQWATNTAGIDPKRIVVFGQSMGSSVAIALTQHLALQKISIAGLIITGSFPDVPTMLSEYRTIFNVRAFGILARYPYLMALCTRGMHNRWPNLERLADVVRNSPAYHIEIFHAQDDPIVPWSLSNTIFQHTVSVANDMNIEKEVYGREKNKKIVDMKEGGWYIEWPTCNGLIRQEVPRHGEHDKIMTCPQVALAVRRAFKSTASALERADYAGLSECTM
ncbi:hypothetical protein J1614_001111 [Plenodomus biglobosus]|nr:hypothetical protein J1614_001111 [Plenodomus biglobosus]